MFVVFFLHVGNETTHCLTYERISWRGETKNSFPDSGNDPINLNSVLFTKGERERNNERRSNERGVRAFKSLPPASAYSLS